MEWTWLVTDDFALRLSSKYSHLRPLGLFLDANRIAQLHFDALRRDVLTRSRIYNYWKTTQISLIMPWKPGARHLGWVQASFVVDHPNATTQRSQTTELGG